MVRLYHDEDDRLCIDVDMPDGSIATMRDCHVVSAPILGFDGGVTLKYTGKILMPAIDDTPK